MTSNILVFGHRGAPKEAPENTLKAFEKAYEAGAHGVELDVRKTKDDKLVVIHNEELDSGDKEEYIFDYTYTELQQRMPELPLLEEVISYSKNKLRLEIEVKRQDLFTVRTSLDLVAQYQIADSVEMISFHPAVLAAVKQISPRIKTGFIFEPFPEWMQGRYREAFVMESLRIIDADVAHLGLEVLTKSMVELIHNDKRRVQASSVETTPQLEEAIKLKVDQLTTNDPRMIMKLLT